MEHLRRQPSLNPNLAELVDRLERQAARPPMLTMSPATWEGLRAEPEGDALCREHGADRRLAGVPVRFLEDCLGVAIGRPEH